jgi:DNA-binding transcriptional LysR family regulator
MIDRYLLRYFLAIVDQGNFSRAAAHCNVSQPTLSVGIAKLERELGAALFFRSNQRVQLTDAGTRFLAHARRIETEFELAQSAILTSRAAARPLRIGILHSVAAEPVAAAVRAARDTLAEQPVEILYGSERELIGHLGRGRIDVALTLCERGSDRFLEQVLLREGYRVALPGDHTLAGTSEVAAEALAGETMIVRRHCEALAQTSRFFTDRGVRPHFALRSHSDERVLAMIAAGLGLTVMPESFAHPDVAFPRLTGFDLRRAIGFAYGHEAEHLRDAPPPLLAALVLAMVAEEGLEPPTPGL